MPGKKRILVPELDAETIHRLKYAVDQAVRARVKTDSLGRNIVSRPRSEAVARVDLRRKKALARSAVFQKALTRERWAKEGILELNDRELKCTLCGKVSSKYNAWGRHERTCQNYVSRPTYFKS